ncbi:MAG: hypothetical protein ACRD37_11720 [Candidatus Acidiferrales bacterium]
MALDAAFCACPILFAVTKKGLVLSEGSTAGEAHVLNASPEAGLRVPTLSRVGEGWGS